MRLAWVIGKRFWQGDGSVLLRRIGAVSGALARKDMDIERLVIWALRDQGLGWERNVNDKAREDYSDYGTIIDRGSGVVATPNIERWSDEDAMLVKIAVDGLSAEARTLIVQYGRAGLRPDWVEEGYGSIQQLKDNRGRLRWDWADPVNRTGAKTPKLGFVGEQRESVDFHRAQYRVWWQALADLVGPLNNKMSAHRATGPDVPEEPWRESNRPRVFDEDGVEIAAARLEPKVSDLPLDRLKKQANMPVQSVATDWSIPKRMPRRSAAR
jgi:hypothetical protein